MQSLLFTAAIADFSVILQTLSQTSLSIGQPSSWDSLDMATEMCYIYKYKYVYMNVMNINRNIWGFHRILPAPQLASIFNVVHIQMQGQALQCKLIMFPGSHDQIWGQSIADQKHLTDIAAFAAKQIASISAMLCKKIGAQREGWK